MLLRFGAKNHKSICDYQEISLAATNLKGRSDTLNKIDSGAMEGQEFVPVVALYGANSAGKSNMLDALHFMDKAICSSYPAWDAADTLPFSPCRAHADKHQVSEVSTYDIDLLVDNVRCHYGFEISSEGIKKEWLYYFPTGVRRVIFFRNFTESKSGEVYYGPSLKGAKDYRDHETNDRYLLISVARHREMKNRKNEENNFELAIKEDGSFDFQLLSNKISKQLIFTSLDAGSHNEHHLARYLQNESIKNKVVSILQNADFGLVDILVEEREINSLEKELQIGLAKLINNVVPGSATDFHLNEKTRIIRFVHRTCEGKTFSLDYANESYGTIQLLALLVPILSTLKDGSTLLVDELTTALHTQLTEKIISLFSKADINKNKAQFIFSTHDTNILSSALLRRDEIWFAEKNTDGQTSIYPLSDFKTRIGDNLEKGYLGGRFGAIPYFGDIESLFEGC